MVVAIVITGSGKSNDARFFFPGQQPVTSSVHKIVGDEVSVSDTGLYIHSMSSSLGQEKGGKRSVQLRTSVG